MAQKNYIHRIQHKNLLVITPIYPNSDESYYAGTFVKYQLEYIKQYFEKIYVISPVYQSLKILEKDILCEDYQDEKIIVFYPRCVYYPEFFFNKIVLDNRLKVVEKTIEKNKLEFDMIHAHFTWPIGYIGSYLKKKYNVPLITTIHEDRGWFCREVESQHPYFIQAWSDADTLIRVNKRDLAVLKRYNSNAICIPNGYIPAKNAVEKDQAREILGIRKDVKVLFSLGTLIKRKGFNYLIDSLNILSNERDDFISYIGGVGKEEKNLSNQINSYKLNGKVKLIGSVTNEELYLWYYSCDIFFLPSLNEGNPTVMFEALGCGRPYVGTDVGGVPEIINSEDYGLLTTPKNSKGLSDILRIALDKEWDEERILEYSQQYTWENIAKIIYGYYLKN